jgi:ribosomal protein S8
MTVTPCEQNARLRLLIESYAEVLKNESHKLGDHGLDKAEFYNSGLFRGAIERVRGQFSATMREKREFVRNILNHMQDQGYISDWRSAGEANRHDYTVNMPSGRISVIELKGCLDGNNTNIFERPNQANEFVIWSVCTNPGADPRHNAWSGIHTRLGAEIIARQQRVDGLVVWDMVCGTIGRPCPKIVSDLAPRFTPIGSYERPPPCIYVFPATVPAARTNPNPPAQSLEEVHFMKALHDCFQGDDREVNYVDFKVAYVGVDTVRTTRIKRGGVTVVESGATAIRRSGS